MASRSSTGAGSLVPNNNGGKMIGNSNSTQLTALSLSDVALPASNGGKQIPNPTPTGEFEDSDGSRRAFSTSGGYAYQSNDSFMIRGAGTARAGKINGDASPLLTTPGPQNAFSSVVVRSGGQTTQLGNPRYAVPVLPDSGRNPGLIADADTGTNYKFPSTTDDQADADDKALKFPGRLTYRTGASAPVTGDM